jgi:4-hydroxy-tetrahydrodipicolinate synthase
LDRAHNIIAIKDATKDITQLTDTIRMIGKRVPVIAGAEEIAFFGLAAGSRGVTSGMANFAPEIPVSMCRAANEGRLEEARSIFIERLLRFRHLDVPGLLQGYPIQNAYIKEAMNIIGMAGGVVRPPLVGVSDEKIPDLRETLEHLRLVPAQASAGSRR